jgi:hypothetical protein
LFRQWGELLTVGDPVYCAKDVELGLEAIGQPMPTPGVV